MLMARACSPCAGRSPVGLPVGSLYPQPGDLHIKLTSEAYLRSLHGKLMASTKGHGTEGSVSATQAGHGQGLLPSCTEAAMRQRAEYGPAAPGGCRAGL
jgi:hypothetical protein